MNILQALRALRPEHTRLAAGRPFLTPEEGNKLDRMNTAIRAACIRKAGLEAVGKALEDVDNTV